MMDSDRKRIMVILAVGLLVFGVYQFTVDPWISTMKTVQASIVTAQTQVRTAETALLGEKRVEGDWKRVGEQMARFREVSHCYRRPVYPSWPYPLFAMVHAKTHSACLDVVRRIEEVVGQFPHKNLFSTKEYKKTRVRYFTPELDDWWKRVSSQDELLK